MIFALEGMKNAIVLLNGPMGCRFYHSTTSQFLSIRPLLYLPTEDGKERVRVDYNYLNDWFFRQERVPCTYLDGYDYVYSSRDKVSRALDFIRETGVETIGQHEQALMRRFYNGVKDIPGVKIYGDFSGAEKAAIVALNVGDYDSGAVADELSESYDIAVRPGAHCAPLMHKALGTTDQGAVRFSFSWFNTDEEIDTAVRAIREIAEDPE